VWDGSATPVGARFGEPLRERGVDIVLGGDGMAMLDRDPAPRTVIVSPGLPDDLPLLRGARARGLTVIDEAELAWRRDLRPWVGVTGTNGKSTTTHLVAAVLEASGMTPILGGNTYAALPLSALAGIAGDVVLAELSSFQLDRSDTLVPEVGVLTNIGRDHLDRHRTRNRYAATKATMFLRDGAHAHHAAIGIDDEYGRRIAQQLRDRGSNVVTFGATPAADVSARAVDWDLGTATVELVVAGAVRSLRTLLPGPHNAANVAGAIALAQALELDLEAAAGAVATTPPPPGRFQHVPLGDHVDGVVDFAKNAAGVAVALATARHVAATRGGRVVAVVSAVPSADPTGLHEMGEAAGRGADLLFVTSDRTSPDDRDTPDPELVRGARSGAPRVEVIPDRPAALADAVSAAVTGDVVIVLGRPPGPVPWCAPDGTVTPLDDASELRQLVSA
jgi:UDP-N-acetylmuramoylalanine-D-glutamate ligase